MDTALTDLFGIRIPLIQAPMAGVSTPELAAAVCRAGALGSVALGALGATQADQVLEATRRLCPGPLVANVFTHQRPRRDAALEQGFLASLAPLFGRFGGKPPAKLEEIYRSFNDDDDLLTVLLQHSPAAVSCHFGVPAADRIDALKGSGIRLLATATTAAEARLLASAGVDVIIAQGAEAGGHAGRFLDEGDASAVAPGRNTAEAFSEINAAVALPVVVAGGLSSGADITAFIRQGAAGAQLGTAFVACPETTAGPAYVEALRTGRTTRVTGRISGRPARGIENQLMRAIESIDDPVPDYPLTYDAVKQLVAVAADPAFTVMWSGTGEVRPLPAAELVALLAAEMDRALWT